MELSFKDIPFYDELNLQGSFQWPEQHALLLTGDNGVGKSSLLQYFKLYQDRYFPGLVCRFMDQGRLEPLNQISFNQLRQQLQEFSLLSIKMVLS
jgi:ABC-type molybdenum transport system ATPase subunit/photorepair protein PhrA